MVREFLGRAVRGELSKAKSLLVFGGFSLLSLVAALFLFPTDSLSVAIVGAMGLAWLGLLCARLWLSVEDGAYLRAARSLGAVLFVCVIALAIVDIRDALVTRSDSGIEDKLDRTKTSLNVSRFLVPTAAHPFTGFWKEKCTQSFGYAVHAAGPGFYAVCFCGPGGCSKPGVDCSSTDFRNTLWYRVIDSNTMDVLALDGYSRYVRCTPSFARGEAQARAAPSAVVRSSEEGAAARSSRPDPSDTGAPQSRGQDAGSSSADIRIIAPAIPVQSDNVAFIKAVNASLELLRQRAPSDFMFARKHVALIREVAQWKDVGMEVMREAPIAKLRPQDVMASPTWAASVIVHEACHGSQYMRAVKRHSTRFPPNHEFSGRIAELECLTHQAAVLERLDAPAAEIASVRAADGRHYRRDERGNYRAITPESWWDPSASDPRSVPRAR